MEKLPLAFGHLRARAEGAPMHPDDLEWEHPSGSGCPECQAHYDRQLKAYEEWEKKNARNA